MTVVLEKAPVKYESEIAPGLFVFRLDAPRIAESARPGQFVQIDPGDEFFLRRPFSIQDAGEGEIELLIKVVGRGTAALVKRGSPWDVMGPLGAGFTIHSNLKAVLVGGGVGVAPLKMLFKILERQGVPADFYVGAGTARDIPFAADDPLRGRLITATDDGSAGFKGTVVDCLRTNLKEGDEPFIYACGPEPMLFALRDFMLERGLDGEFSLESRMACGMGVCQGCAVPAGEGYILVCKEGPVAPFNYIEESVFTGGAAV